MTTNNQNVDNSTSVLVKESQLAQLAEERAAERDRVNTRLCYERALGYFYEEEGINPEDEKDAKMKEEEEHKKLDNMSLVEEYKYKFKKFKEDLQDPIRKKIRFAEISGIIISIFRALILFGLCFIIFMPIFEKLSYALRSPEDISNKQVIWIPENWSILNIQIAFKLLTNEGNTYINTIGLSAVITVLQVMATAIPGYAFARLKFKGSNIIFYLVIASLAIPNEAMKIARSIFFTNTGFFGYSLVNTALAIPIMTLFGSGVRSAIFIFLFRQAFRNLPIELEESAEIDGASVIRTFWSVMLPNVRGTIITVALFAFVWQYNDYYYAQLFSYQRSLPLLTTSLAGSTETLNSVIGTTFPELAKEMGNVIGEQFYELIAQTSALLMMIPVLFGYLFVQKLFVESVERSGITGM
jgi:multiple sugar transport system permease protein